MGSFGTLIKKSAVESLVLRYYRSLFTLLRKLTMTQDELKQKVAQAALHYIKDVGIIGVGTGSTVKHFIDFLGDFRADIEGAVSSSEVSTAHLKKVGIPVFDLNAVGTLDVYIDGADEVSPHKHLIKGGGGALTREKIIASMAKQFICICDASKQVAVLGNFALPVEIIPLSKGIVTQELAKLGGTVSLRMAKDTRADLGQTPSQPFVTDNGGWILDVAGLKITNPLGLETQINQIAGVITVGLFAKEKADILLVSNVLGVSRMTF